MGNPSIWSVLNICRYTATRMINAKRATRNLVSNSPEAGDVNTTEVVECGRRCTYIDCVVAASWLSFQ
jgi:hypothetical protein